MRDISILKNRPFVTFCIVFILSSVCLFEQDMAVKLFAAATFAAIGAFALILSHKAKFQIKALFVLLCAVFALLAPISQIFLYDIPKDKALSFEGERKIDAVITEAEYKRENYAEYLVCIERVEDERVSYSSRLICGFGAELSVGDRVYALCEITPSDSDVMGYVRQHGEDEFIQLCVYDEERLVKVSENNLNAEILMGKLRASVSRYLDFVFEGGEALAKGFLIGDTSEVRGDVLRDFRRSGTSHMLAVSGMHLAIIIGALEWLLEKIGTRRGARCALLSIATLIFLAISGFSASACRSAIMLFAVYLSYVSVKEHDSLGALFFAVSLIILVSPCAVKDIGLWLSFLATLGILTVWKYFSGKLRRRREAGVSGRVKYILRAVTAAFLMTFVCNTFISLVVLEVFGEISTVSVIANPVLSPIVSFYMVALLVSCVIPIAAPLANAAGGLIVESCRYFSSFDGALLSLKYGFARIVIVLMSVSLAVMLVISLRRKWLIILPPILASVVLSAGVGIYSYLNAGVASGYYFDGKNEMLILSQGGSASIVDMSSGSYGTLYKSLEIASDRYATEVDSFVVTHYHKYLVTTLSRMLCQNYVRCLYLPEPKDADDREIAQEILEVAREYRVSVRAYSGTERLGLGGDAWCVIERIDDGASAHGGLCVLVGNKSDTLGYVCTHTITDVTQKIAQNSNHLIFGKHFGALSPDMSHVDTALLRGVYYAERASYDLRPLPSGEYDSFVIDESLKRGYFELVLN